MNAPTLYFEDGSPVPPEQAAKARMGKSGTVGVISHREACYRCGGAGGWHGWPGFTCYRCYGKDSHQHEYVKTKVWTRTGLDRLHAARARAEAKREAKYEAFKADRAAFIQEHGLERLWAADVRPDSFLGSLQAQLRTKGSLSEKQVAAAAAAFEKIDARAERDAQSEHVGAEGDRVTLEARVAFVKDLDGYYGPKRLVKLLTADQDVLVTFSTSAWVWDLEGGEEVTITGTVKDHDTYQGTAQTVLTRTKLETNR